jgi:hypothetical protein
MERPLELNVMMADQRTAVSLYAAMNPAALSSMDSKPLLLKK